MTNDDICRMIEWEGLPCLLRDIRPDEVSDVAVGEALADVQEAFRSLMSVLPDIDLDIIDDTSQLELDFDE